MKQDLKLIKSKKKHTFSWRPMSEEIKEDRPIIFLTKSGAMKTFKHGLGEYERTAVAWCYQCDLIPDFSTFEDEKPYKRYQEINELLMQSDVISDVKRSRELSIELSSIEETVKSDFFHSGRNGNSS